MALDGLTLVVVVLELKSRRMEEALVDDIVLEVAMVSGLPCALVECSTATFACIARVHLDQSTVKG